MPRTLTLPGNYEVFKFSAKEKKEYAGKFNYAIKKGGKIWGFTDLKALNKATNFYGVNRFNKKSWG